MTTWQAARQIAFKLLSRSWPDAPAGPVFAQVFVSQGLPEDSGSLRFPFALVRVLDGTADPDDQTYQLQRFEVVSVVSSTGDQVGEQAMVGGHRQSQGRSQGRGLLEVEEQVMQAVQYLNQTNAFRIQLVSAGTAEAALVPDVGYVVSRALTFQARLTTSRVYPTPNAGKSLVAAVNTGVVTLTWTWHERADLHKAYTPPQIGTARGKLTLVRKAGSSAPTSVTDGTLVALSSNAATTVADSPGAGTWSYALFAQYDEFGDATGSPALGGTSVRVSTPATALGIVV